MCTVTIIPRESGVRLACNRDESRARPAALHPRIVTIGDRRAIMPIDPLSGGSWIAVNDVGLVFSILNANPLPRPTNVPTPKRSRGTSIPDLVSAATLEEAYARTDTLKADTYAGFRLVMVDERRIANVYCNRSDLIRTPPSDLSAPVMFTSSGLGDAVVDSPRRKLFEGWFTSGLDRRQRQDEYHRHTWPDQPELSVCMRRSDARTVSLTIVEIDTREARMIYHAEAPDQPTNAILTSLDRVVRRARF